MSHVYHEGLPNFDPEAILQDDCPRCTEHAEHPVYSLDAKNICRLWTLMLAVESGAAVSYRTVNEAKAASKLWQSYILLERHTSIDPNSLIVGSLAG